MLRSLRRAALLCLLLVCLPAASMPSLVVAPPDPPSTMQGFLRYKVRGLSAVQGGFLSSSIFGVATGVGMHSAVLNTLKLLVGAGKLSGNSSMAEMHKYLSTGKGFDFSGAPVSAGYDIHLDFVLEADKKGDYRLKSGNATYSGNTDADLTLGGKGGNIHRFTDRLRGQGTAKLTAENASITLTYEGKGKDRRAKFDVGVNFPVTVAGKTTWSAMGGLIVISQDNNTTHVITPFGPPMIDKNSGVGTSDWPASVVYSRSGPLDSVLRGRETWQDLRDSGELVEWELWSECAATMEIPVENDELVWDLATPAKLVRRAEVDVQPTFWEQDLDWSFHEIGGSDLEPRPDGMKGNAFDVTYTKLPDKNTSFAYWDVSAKFVTERARKAGCKDPKPRTVGYFYPRDGTNHGGKSGPVDPAANFKGPTPNWFHYWQQTRAALGHAAVTRYGAGSETCNTPGVGGYYTRGTSHIVVCDLGQAWGHHLSHPLVHLELDGIDNYAAVVLHEWRHLTNYEKWWKGKGQLADTEVCEQKKGEIVTKTIGDGIPDAVESTVRIPSPLNGDYTYFDNTVCDTPGLGFTDEHYTAWMAMTEWKVGSAVTEDWACPGTQTLGNCK